MKVILINHYKAGFPFIDELAQKLQENGVDTLILDIYDMLSVRYQNNVKDIEYHTKYSFVRKALKVPKVGSLIKKTFYARYIQEKGFRDAHISLHFVSPYYKDFFNFFKEQASSVSAVVWGSDFYRASEKSHRKIQEIFDGCDDIIIGNTKMASDFTSLYGKYSEKIRPVGFGIGKLDLIDEVSASNELIVLKKDLNIPSDKLILTIGYNGIKEQQHLLIINAINNIPAILKQKLFILIPFGYGGQKSYKLELEEALEKTKVKYLIFDKFLSDDEVAKMRLCTDLAINAQISDASSASIQEHLYAENVLLVGSWLPYQYFRNNGIKFWEFTEPDLTEQIVSLLTNFNEYKQEVKLNKDRVYNLSSWNARIKQWINVYSGSYRKSNPTEDQSN